MDDVFHFCAGCIGAGGGNHAAVVIGGGNGVFRLPDSGAGGGFEFGPQGFIKIVELLKAKAAHQACGAVLRDPRGFYGDGAAAAEWVLHGLRAVVACEQHQACGKVFAQRGFAGVLAVAAFEQGFTAGVYKDAGGFVV